MIDDKIKSNVREVELPSELFPLVVVEKGRKVMADHLEPKVGQFFSHQPHKLYCSHYSTLHWASINTNRKWPKGLYLIQRGADLNGKLKYEPDLSVV